MREIREIMADTQVEVLSMKEAGICIEVVEDGTTFEENAIKKAKQYYEIAKKRISEYSGRPAKLDMHIHSDMSDGLFSIPQIISMAKEFGLECIFITDHNSCLPEYQLINSFSKAYSFNAV